MKTLFVLAAVLLSTQVQASENYRCSPRNAKAWPGVFEFSVNGQEMKAGNRQAAEATLQRITRATASRIDGYERPSATQETFAIPAWNSNDAAAFILFPRASLGRAFTMQLTYDEEGGAPFNPSTDAEAFTCIAM